MYTSLSLWCSALVGLSLLTSSSDQRPEPTPAIVGHLILLVEGDATRLSVTHITRKPDAFGGVRRGLQSDYQVALFTAAGEELGRYPIDLSQFDLRPTRVGGPVQVEGCIVRDPRVLTLVNVPGFVEVGQIRIYRKQEVIGSVDAEVLERLVEGRKR